MKSRYWLLLGVALLTGRCEPHKEADMKDLLRQTAVQSFFVPENAYASMVRVAYFDSLLQVAPSHEINAYRYQKAINLLVGGKTEAAIQLLESLRQLKKRSRFVAGLKPREEEMIDAWLAIGYLRLGEQQNCILNHSSASCIVPVQAPGFHQLPAGSQQAIQLFEEILQRNPRDLSSRWLLNVAYMTLNKYPHEVPEEWLIPVSAFQSDYPLKHFEDVALQAGLSDNDMAGGVVTEDFNNDGLIDLMTSSWFADKQIRLFMNNGQGTFTEKTQEAKLTGLTGGLNMVQADYNNDGFTDVFVLRGAWLEKLGKHPNSLLRNNGDGTFTDVTQETGLLSFHPTQTAVWSDFNNDGWIDLFIGNESSSADNVHLCELYLNNGNGTFAESAAQAGVMVSKPDHGFYYVKGVTAGDYNNDGWTDIFVSALDESNSNLLFRNNGAGHTGLPTFTEVSKQTGLDEPISTFPAWFWDYDNDGWLDIFAAGFRRSLPWESIAKDVAAEYLGLPHSAETARLYRNNHDGTFTNVSEKVGLKKITYAMGANFGDLDNDGFLDMYLATGEVNFASFIPNRAFRNDGGKQFQDVTTAGGFGNLQKGHGVAFADMDNDGDQDCYTVLGGAYEGDVFQNSLFKNPYQSDNQWISLLVEGKNANRSAIGARIKIIIRRKNGKLSTIYNVVNSGGSFGASSLRQEIGLGDATEIVRLEIRWPTVGQAKQVHTGLSGKHFYKITEGAKATELFLPHISLGEAIVPHTHD